MSNLNQANAALRDAVAARDELLDQIRQADLFAGELATHHKMIADVRADIAERGAQAIAAGVAPVDCPHHMQAVERQKTLVEDLPDVDANASSWAARAEQLREELAELEQGLPVLSRQRLAAQHEKALEAEKKARADYLAAVDKCWSAQIALAAAADVVIGLRCELDGFPGKVGGAYPAEIRFHAPHGVEFKLDQITRYPDQYGVEIAAAFTKARKAIEE